MNDHRRPFVCACGCRAYLAGPPPRCRACLTPIEVGCPACTGPDTSDNRAHRRAVLEAVPRYWRTK